MNESFISIKVDKEERPDLDTVYMTACRALGGEGGWPLNVFLTPYKKPFFAGSYFPCEDKSWQIGFKSLLLNIKEAWEQKSASLSESAGRLTEFLNKPGFEPDQPITGCTAEDAKRRLISAWDTEYGGVGDEPKFPMPHLPIFLLKYYQTFGETDALEMAENTLLAIYRGGIHDHIGGGYFRYATDRQWLAPHFEKMTEDNALLAIAFSYAAAVTQKQLFSVAAKECLDFLSAELKSGDGGFFTAVSSESNGDEGGFYLWLPGEITDILGGDRGVRFCGYYNISESPGFRGKSLPHIDGQMFLNPFEKEISLLKTAREKRSKPPIDNKILTAPCALCAAAFAAYAKAADISYLPFATETADFLLGNMRKEDGRLKNGSGGREIGAFSPDYAFLIWALTEIYEINMEEKYLSAARRLADELFELFWAQSGGLYFYGRESEQLIIQIKDARDGAAPSANSVFSLALKKLYRATKDTRYLTACQDLFKAFGASATASPADHAFLLFSFLS